MWIKSIANSLLLSGSHVKGMLQPYNHIRLSLLGVNRKNIKCLIRNRTTTKCFLLCKKRIFKFAAIFCSAIFCLNLFHLLFNRMIESCAFWNFLNCAKFFHYYCLFFADLLKRYTNADSKICRHIRL